MKKQIVILFLVLISISVTSFAQNGTKPSLTVLNIDAQGVSYSPVQLGNIVRLEMDKLDQFQVMDKYDVIYLIEKNNLKIDNCYGKICLLEIGKLIKSDKMLTGSVERIGKTIIVTMRLIDVKTETIEKTEVNEFLDLQNEMQRMVNITIREMFDLEIDQELLTLLTKKDNIDNAITAPNVGRLNLSGPRMGLSLLMGEAGEVFQAPENQGGYDAFPLLLQFGYQFEIQYLNEGSVQGLFEVIPMISGVEQGLFIPSMTILHGLRNNKNGLEFAFGPTISVARYAEGYYQSGDWFLRQQWESPTGQQNPNEIVSRLDSRGRIQFSTGFVLAAGFTLKSGKLNIPINAYIIPRKGNFRVGVSFGFNVKR
jgi:hypothetical protein